MKPIAIALLLTIVGCSKDSSPTTTTPTNTGEVILSGFATGDTSRYTSTGLGGVYNFTPFDSIRISVTYVRRTDTTSNTISIGCRALNFNLNYNGYQVYDTLSTSVQSKRFSFVIHDYNFLLPAEVRLVLYTQTAGFLVNPLVEGWR